MTETQPQTVTLEVSLTEVAQALLGAIDLADKMPQVFGTDAAELCSVWCMLTGYDPIEEGVGPDEAVAHVKAQAVAVVAGTAHVVLKPTA